MPDLFPDFIEVPAEPSQNNNPVQHPIDDVAVEEAVAAFVTGNADVPGWFVNLTKTALSRNITLDDWNTLCTIIQKVSKDDVAFERLITMLFENDDNLKDYTDQEVAAARSNLTNYVDTNYVPKTTKVNGHALTGDIQVQKGDPGIELSDVENRATSDAITTYGEEETLANPNNYASVKAVYDYLNFSFIDENGNAKQVSYAEFMKRIDLIWAVFRDDEGSLDNAVNTIVDMLNVLKDYPEVNDELTVADLIKNRLDALEANTEDAFATVGPYYIVASDFEDDPNNPLDAPYVRLSEQENPEYDDYPFVACIENMNFIGARKVSVVYDVPGSGSDIMSSGVKIDITTGKLYLYAVEDTSEPIKIEEIDIINNLRSYRLYNTAIERIVAQDHARIENIEEFLENLPSGGDLLYQHNVSYYAVSAGSTSLHIQDIAFSFLSPNPEAMTGAQILAYLLATLPTNDTEDESPHRNGLVASGKWAFNDTRDSAHEIYDAKCIAKILENNQTYIACRCLGVEEFESNKVLVDNGFRLEETFTYDGQTIQTMEDKVSLTVPII